MSRPEDLPRSASPLKRRAPSLPPNDSSTPNADATEDVDMLPVPAAGDDVSMADGEPAGDTDHCAQDGHPHKPKARAQESLGLEETGPDIPGRSNGLDADRASVEETQAGSEHEEGVHATGAPLVDDAQGRDQDQDQEPGGDNGNASADRKLQGQKAFSSNSEDAADSDAKTVDTTATSASLEPLNQSRWSKPNPFISNPTR